MQPLIALTVGEIINARYPWTPISQGQTHTYIDAVLRAGGVPFLVPLIDDENKLRQLYEISDGLLFCGGNDIGPRHYGMESSDLTEGISPARDKQELAMLSWALADNKSVFGICRGMQLINVALKGSLHQDIAAKLPSADDHLASANQEDFRHIAHSLSVKPDSRLAKILGSQQIKTNSLHHQSVDKLGSGLIVTAQSEDGVVEALELPSKKFVLGIQSHPEALEAKIEPQWRKLFKAFVDSTKP
jgi:putative glutamine amidotransferase